MPKSPVQDQRLRKVERLRSKKEIDSLFKAGRSTKAYPFLAVWQTAESESPFPAQMAVSVAKKRIKRAVDRNLVKRRVREAYRREKLTLYKALTEKGLTLKLMFIFTGKEIPSYEQTQVEIKRIVKRLTDTLLD